MTSEKLTKAQRELLNHVLWNGPCTPPMTTYGAIPKAVTDLLSGGLLERLSSLDNLLVVEITPAGRTALSLEGG